MTKKEALLLIKATALGLMMNDAVTCEETGDDRAYYMALKRQAADLVVEVQAEFFKLGIIKDERAHHAENIRIAAKDLLETIADLEVVKRELTNGGEK